LEVLKGVDTKLERGHKTAIVGPSGCGKSTMLRCINYMETPSAGHIHLDGELFGERQVDGGFRRMSEKELANQRAHVGMVFQGFYLWPHLNARDNVAIGPMKVGGLSRAAAYELGSRNTPNVYRAGSSSASPSPAHFPSSPN
jgi:polar amino acid transport system ATP-binding protein